MKVLDKYEHHQVSKTALRNAFFAVASIVNQQNSYLFL